MCLNSYKSSAKIQKSTKIDISNSVLIFKHGYSYKIVKSFKNLLTSGNKDDIIIKLSNERQRKTERKQRGLRAGSTKRRTVRSRSSKIVNKSFEEKTLTNESECDIINMLATQKAN